MILNRIKLEDIVSVGGVNFQNVVIDAIVDKEADLPLPSALSSQNYIIVAPSKCHCTKESTDWEMDSNGDWYKQTVQTSGGGGGGGGVIYIGDYYTKTEVDNLIADFVDETDVQNDITAALTDYYTSAQVDALLPDMTNYYTKSETYSKAEVDALIPTIPSTYDADDITYDNTTSGLAATDVQNALDELAAAIPSIPSNYDADDIIYDNTTSGLTATNVQDALDEVVGDLPDMSLYYTSSQTDSAISAALSGYYTSAQVDSAISTALSGYYTSAQVDSLLGSYYTSSQTDSAISSYWTTNIANYYTKSEVDALIPTVPSTYDADDITYDNSTSGLTATNAQDAIDEVVASIPTVPATYDADDIVYDNTTSGLTATEVQSAIDEVVASIPSIPSTYDADDITYDNTVSGLTATDVQDAIDELAQGGSYTLPIASASTLGGIKVGTGLSIDVDGVLSASGGGGTPTNQYSYNKMYYVTGSTVTGITSAPNMNTGQLVLTVNTGSGAKGPMYFARIWLEPNTSYTLYGMDNWFTDARHSVDIYVQNINNSGTSTNYTSSPITFTTGSTGYVAIAVKTTAYSVSTAKTYNMYPYLLLTSQTNEGFALGFPRITTTSTPITYQGGTSQTNAQPLGSAILRNEEQAFFLNGWFYTTDYSNNGRADYSGSVALFKPNGVGFDIFTYSPDNNNQTNIRSYHQYRYNPDSSLVKVY